ncbi:MAG: hypothetical protein IPP77_00520 [Bacteroidetes bacterium]|nr:hypothetical protein [Bacteroidota bacterium]
MKWILLLAIYVFNSSWISPGTDEAKGTLSATVEGRAFALADGQLMRGVLVKKDGSMDGRTPPRTIINANFTGPTYNNGTERISLKRLKWK